MRYLILGNGNISNTLRGIISTLNEDWNIKVCDIKDDGISGEDYIIKNHSSFDAVVNLTDVHTAPIISLCDEYGLVYLDAGFESDDNQSECEAYLESLKPIAGRKHFFGFGMNPGIVEYIASAYAPNRPYIACEFETDLPYIPEKDKKYVFATWSPYIYFDESAVSESYVSRKDEICHIVPRNQRYNIPVESKDGLFNYCIVPHEEVFSIVLNNNNCKGSAFVFHAPENLQNFAIENQSAGHSIAHSIPVEHNIEGTESVGVIFYDGSDNIYYAVNRADHKECFLKYSHNGTCWQTACGVYVGMCLMEIVPSGTSWTFSSAVKEYKDEIEKILKKLDFNIEVIDNFIDKKVFEERILPVFGDNSKNLIK